MCHRCRVGPFNIRARHLAACDPVMRVRETLEECTVRSVSKRRPAQSEVPIEQWQSTKSHSDLRYLEKRSHLSRKSRRVVSIGWY